MACCVWIDLALSACEGPDLTVWQRGRNKQRHGSVSGQLGEPGKEGFNAGDSIIDIQSAGYDGLTGVAFVSSFSVRCQQPKEFNEDLVTADRWFQGHVSLNTCR